VADHSISEHLQAVHAASRPFLEFLAGSSWGRARGTAGICDFVVGNPQEMPLPGYVEALQRAIIPQDCNWFGYKTNELLACNTAAQYLRERLHVPFAAEDIFMTKGASNALTIVLSTIIDCQEEVIFLSPPWFFYEPMIYFVRGIPVRVRVNMATFELDLGAIAAAITPRTRAVILNSPNNPTGKIYSPDALQELARLLENASARFGRAIYLISDESYSRIVFDGSRFTSPTLYYPRTFLIYSYSKALLTPGQRLGYIAVAPSMPDRDSIRSAIFTTQCAGFGFPDAVLQYAIPEFERLCIDINQLQRRRDYLRSALQTLGYEVNMPEGAWYLLLRTPIENDSVFAEMLAKENVFVLPGTVCEMPGYVRICLTASDDMVEQSIRAFAAVLGAPQSRDDVSLTHGVPSVSTEAA